MHMYIYLSVKNNVYMYLFVKYHVCRNNSNTIVILSQEFEFYIIFHVIDHIRAISKQYNNAYK